MENLLIEGIEDEALPNAFNKLHYHFEKFDFSNNIFLKENLFPDSSVISQERVRDLEMS